MKRMNLIVVFNKDKTKLLMCERTKEPYKGQLNLVGGKIEKEDGNLNEAYRELQEETGITKEDINLVLSEDIIILNKKTEERETYNYEIEMDKIKLPIKKGEKVATLIIKKGNETIKKVSLVSEKDIDKQSFISMYFNNLKTVLFG